MTDAAWWFQVGEIEMINDHTMPGKAGEEQGLAFSDNFKAHREAARRQLTLNFRTVGNTDVH